MNKEEILQKIKEAKPTAGRNSMGVSESWYNSYFATGQTFTEEELATMSETELNNLIKLADRLSDAFY